MIKRYVLHIEAHRRRLPRISFKRAPRPGDRVVDGGIPGTLRRCPTCQEGFLHEPDPRPVYSRPKPSPKPSLLGLFVSELAKSIDQGRSSRVRPVRSHHRPRPAMDLNGPQHVELKVKEKKPVEHVELQVEEETPAEHVELKIEEEKTGERVELMLSEDESPETLDLDYARGTRKYKRGEVVWTHKAEYIVDKLEDNVLHLVRKDVWDERKKNAKHVELKVEEEKPSQIVELKFD